MNINGNDYRLNFEKEDILRYADPLFKGFFEQDYALLKAADRQSFLEFLIARYRTYLYNFDTPSQYSHARTFSENTAQSSSCSNFLITLLERRAEENQERQEKMCFVEKGAVRSYGSIPCSF